MPQSRKRRRDFPFYKVQVFDIKLGTWKDVQRTFDTVELAQQYSDKILRDNTTRVVMIERNSRRPVA
jgi:hypothetical protein